MLTKNYGFFKKCSTPLSYKIEKVNGLDYLAKASQLYNEEKINFSIHEAIFKESTRNSPSSEEARACLGNNPRAWVSCFSTCGSAD